MSWAHEMRRATVRDSLNRYGLRLAGSQGLRPALKTLRNTRSAVRIAWCYLDRGHTAHRALAAGRAIIDGEPWILWQKKPPGDGQPGGVPRGGANNPAEGWASRP